MPSPLNRTAPCEEEASRREREEREAWLLEQQRIQQHRERERRQQRGRPGEGTEALETNEALTATPAPLSTDASPSLEVESGLPEPLLDPIPTPIQRLTDGMPSRKGVTVGGFDFKVA